MASCEGKDAPLSQPELESAEWRPLEIAYSGLMLTDREQVIRKGLEQMEATFKRAFLDPDWTPGTPAHPVVERLAAEHTLDEVADFVGIDPDEASGDS